MTTETRYAESYTFSVMKPRVVCVVRGIGAQPRLLRNRIKA